MTFFITLVASHLPHISCPNRKISVSVFTFLLFVALTRLRYIDPVGRGRLFPMMEPAFMAATLFLLVSTVFSKGLQVIKVLWVCQ